ncbi:hypothetical protein Hdeb2414_s0033g00721401 [Helianthus debilis subsp. tardiflorus]
MDPTHNTPSFSQSSSSRIGVLSPILLPCRVGIGSAAVFADRQTRLPTTTPYTLIGGAAITCKNEFEKINEANLVTVSAQLREAMMMFGSSSGTVLEMDWSKRPETAEAPNKVDDFKEQQ